MDRAYQPFYATRGVPTDSKTRPDCRLGLSLRRLHVCALPAARAVRLARSRRSNDGLLPIHTRLLAIRYRYSTNNDPVTTASSRTVTPLLSEVLGPPGVAPDGVHALCLSFLFFAYT